MRAREDDFIIIKLIKIEHNDCMIQTLINNYIAQFEFELFVVIFFQNENDAIVNINILFKLMLFHFNLAMHSFRVKNVSINSFFEFINILNN